MHAGEHASRSANAASSRIAELCSLTRDVANVNKVAHPSVWLSHKTMDVSALDNEKDDSSPAAPDVADARDAPDSVRVLKPRRAAPADAVRPTRAEVNLARAPPQPSR